MAAAPIADQATEALMAHLGSIAYGESAQRYAARHGRYGPTITRAIAANPEPPPRWWSAVCAALEGDVRAYARSLGTVKPDPRVLAGFSLDHASALASEFVEYLRRETHMLAQTLPGPGDA